jgi:hypothetical protein
LEYTQLEFDDRIPGMESAVSEDIHIIGSEVSGIAIVGSSLSEYASKIQLFIDLLRDIRRSTGLLYYTDTAGRFAEGKGYPCSC